MDLNLIATFRPAGHVTESLNLLVSFLTCQWEMAIPASATAHVLLLAAGDIGGEAMAHAERTLYGHTWLFNLGYVPCYSSFFFCVCC